MVAESIADDIYASLPEEFKLNLDNSVVDTGKLRRIINENELALEGAFMAKAAGSNLAKAISNSSVILGTLGASAILTKALLANIGGYVNREILPHMSEERVTITFVTSIIVLIACYIFERIKSEDSSAPVEESSVPLDVRGHPKNIKITSSVINKIAARIM